MRVGLFLLVAALLLGGCERTRTQRQAMMRLATAPFVEQPPSAQPVGDVVSLDGAWELRFDPDEVGVDSGWPGPSAVGEWLSCSVPGSYHARFPDKRWYLGPVWQRRTFTIPEQWGSDGRLVLRFEGVALRTRIWLNESFLVELDRPFLPIEVDVTEQVRRDGENLLVVETDNRRLPGSVPSADWDEQWPWGGVLRPVSIERRPALAPQRLSVATHRDKQGWRMDIEMEFHADAPASGAVALQLVDSAGNLFWRERLDLLAPDLQPPAQLSAHVAGVQRWSPKQPVTYRLQLVRVTEQGEVLLATQTVGFREFAVSGDRLFLNGESFPVRGIAWMEDFHGVGASLTEAQMRTDLTEIRRLGFNTVRVAFHPPATKLADLCDEIGLLLWVEFPTGGDVATLGDPNIFEQFTAPYLQQMVESFGNHPSVVMWGLGGGIDGSQEEAAWFVATSTQLLRELDPTRPVTFTGPLLEADLCRPLVDVACFDVFPGWGGESIYAMGDMLRLAGEQAAGRPLVISAFGAGALRGRSQGGRFALEGGQYTEEYQAKVIQVQLEQLYRGAETGPAGAVLWCFNDYASPAADGPDHPAEARHVRQMGLVTRRREPKAAASLVRDYFSVRDMLEPRPLAAASAAQPPKNRKATP